MYRLLVILGLLMVLYFLVRRVVREFKSGHLDRRGLSVDQDQMVQDPVCLTFVPKKIAVEERVGEQTYWFCSSQCAADFQKQRSG
jgi:YHS domain-containing protein